MALYTAQATHAIATQDQATDKSPSASRKRRATVACRRCNLHKIRCDFVTVGRPCTKCALNESRCELATRKKREKRSTTSRRQTSIPGEEDVSEAVQPAQPLSSEGGFETSGDQDQEDELSPRPPALDFTDALASGRESYFYAGPHQGGALEAAGGSHGNDASPAARFLSAGSAKRTGSDKDEAFLRAKGVFSMFSPEITGELISSFFTHIFPLLPIIDVTAFFESYNKHGVNGVSLLLFWSLSHAGTNHVQSRVIRQAGFKSRSEMKQELFARAKAAFDLSIESDRIIVLQSATILAYSASNFQDQFDDWYWLGAAISLCFDIGLHRSCSSKMAGQGRVNPMQVRICARIWWSCITRDRWFALVRSRPFRMQLGEREAPLPQLSDDLAQDLSIVSADVRSKYFDTDAAEIGRCWFAFIHGGFVLGNVISSRIGDVPASVSATIEHQLAAVMSPPTGTGEHNHDSSRSTIALQVHLFRCALNLLWHQPAVLKAFTKYRLRNLDPQTLEALNKSITVTSTMLSIIQEILRRNLVEKIIPIFITMMVPAMQIHLMDSMSKNPRIRRLGEHSLELYMMLLSDMKADHWGADLVCRIFGRVQEKRTAQQRPAGTQQTTSSAVTSGLGGGPSRDEAPVRFDVESTFSYLPSIPLTSDPSPQPMATGSEMSYDLSLPDIDWDELTASLNLASGTDGMYNIDFFDPNNFTIA